MLALLRSIQNLFFLDTMYHPLVWSLMRPFIADQGHGILNCSINVDFHFLNLLFRRNRCLALI